jgi:hypothetical protein
MLAPAERASLDQRAGRDVAHREVIARLDVGVRPGLHNVALLETLRGDDVALVAVKVMQQRDIRRAVRVVLDVSDLGVDAVLVVATEVDHPVGALMATALVPGGDAAVGISAAGAVQRT